MPLTEEQRNAMEQVRAAFSILLIPPSLGRSVESLDERARLPDPGTVPTDLTVKVEIAPPSPNPHPLLHNKVPLKTPDPVPVFFYALHSDKMDSDVGDTRVIFHMHSGGNVSGHPSVEPFVQFYARLLRAVASRSGDASKCVLVAPCYRLATLPQNAFPAALQDVVAAYEYVLSKGYNPSNIVISGDSAGGNHAIVLTHLITRRLTDLSEQAKANASGFDILTVPVCETMSSYYVGDSGVALTDPLVSGAYLPFMQSWPKTLILVSGGDTLIDASRELKKRLAAVNAPVELVEYDELPHAWWVMSELFLGEIQDAAQKVARFLLESQSSRL
ncbi:Alpha/Beta hydrolase protein [Chiua virens]|nr:Alpha/Beta hydrolase protein [Chiua virens]